VLDPRTAKLMRAAHGIRKLLFVFLLVAAILTAVALSVAEPGRLFFAAKFALACAAFAALALLVINLLAIRAWVRGRRGADTD